MAQLIHTGSELIREPGLLVPGKKPVGNVRVDWSHPLARGLVLFADYGGRFADRPGSLNTGGYDCGRLLVNKIGAVFTGASVDSTTETKYDGRKGRYLTSEKAGGIMLESGWDNSWLSSQEVTFIVCLRRTSSSDQFFSAFDTTDDSHYPYGGVFYCGMFRANRITLTGVYDSSIDDEFHTVAIVNSLSQDRWEVYTKGISRYQTTDNWGIPSTASIAHIFGANGSADMLKDISWVSIYDRALSSSEILALERDNFSFLIPA